jgi:hypothetical protein
MRKVRRRTKNLFNLFILILLLPFNFILLVIIHNPSIILIILLDNLIKTVWLIIKDILNIIWTNPIYPKWDLIILRTKHHIWVTICLIWHHRRDKTLKCILAMSFITSIMSIITILCLCTKEIVIIHKILQKNLLLVMECLIMDLNIC